MRRSEHPLARAILKKAREADVRLDGPAQLTDFRYLARIFNMCLSALSAELSRVAATRRARGCSAWWTGGWWRSATARSCMTITWRSPMVRTVSFSSTFQLKHIRVFTC